MINVAIKHLERKVFLNGNPVEIGPSQRRVIFIDSHFDWGDTGPGAMQLGCAILLELTGDNDFAMRYYKEFTGAWVSKLPSKDLVTWSKVDEWIVDKGGRIANSYKLGVV